jgi:protein phosphatase
MELICAGITDVGTGRDLNEDNFYLSQGDEALCVVADGMGGHLAGEVASSMAIDAIVESYRNKMLNADFDADAEERGVEADELIRERLVDAIQSANRAVFEAASEDEEREDMGTTIVSGYFIDNEVYLAHIGDSRVYRLRDGEFEQRTNDHSLANEYVEMGILAADDVEYFPYKNVITRACGLDNEVDIEINSEDVQSGDIYLFCSDGLTDMVNDEKIRETLMASEDLDATCETLVQYANENGGEDNITVILAEIQ